jgi:hypothetical protein
MAEYALFSTLRHWQGGAGPHGGRLWRRAEKAQFVHGMLSIYPDAVKTEHVVNNIINPKDGK